MKKNMFAFYVWFSQSWGLIVLALFIILGVLIALCHYDPIDRCIPNLKQLGTMAAVVTVLSIVFVIATLKQQQSLFEAQILNEYNKEYMDKEMLDFVRVLGAMSSRDRTKYGKWRAPECNLCQIPNFHPDDDYQWTKEEDNARRKVKGYFIDVLDLYLEGKISREIFRRIVNKSALTLLFDVVEPMEWYLNEDYDYTKFYKIMLIAGDIYQEQKKTDANFRSKKRIQRVKDKNVQQASAAHHSKITGGNPCGQTVSAKETLESGNTCSTVWNIKVSFDQQKPAPCQNPVSGKIDINLTW